MPEQLILVGASVRAAASSAVHGGFEPYSIDLFQDLDLSGPGELVRRYPAGFWPALRRAPQASWLYTGGLENHPRLIERCGAARPLLGVSSQALRRVRDPLWLQEICQAHGVRFPQTLAPGATRPAAGRWLLKRRRSSGGLGVIRSAEQPSVFATNGSYWQREIEPLLAEPCDYLAAGAVFLADQNACELLYVTRQYFASDISGQRPFLYAGSLGPWPVVPAVRDEIQRVGELLARHVPLVGVFGVDLIVRNAETWVIEVNPRFPASAELWERSSGRSIVAAHVAVCRGNRKAKDAVVSISDSIPSECAFHGKRVVYSNVSARTAGSEFSQALQELAAVTTQPQVADIPRPGTRIEPGQPLATAFASGPTPEATETRLAQLAGQVVRLWSEVL